MKKRILSVLIFAFLLLGSLSINSFALNEEEIVILYESDVHCAVEGYSKLAALKNELLQTNAYVGAVSVGDYIQGGTLGTISRGQYIVELMNLVGYDAVTLGNHEFDYKIERLNELVDMMDTKPVSCNFQKLGETDTVFEPYKMVRYGDIDIAYVGITTPSTVSSSSPAQFKNDKGEYIYTFNGESLIITVQNAIDAAKTAGADYIIGLSHLGSEYVDDAWSVQTVIAGTDGFDAVLDGHSHSVIESRTLTDKGGNSVVISSVGTKFAYIGKMIISNGDITTTLIDVSEYNSTDAQVDARLGEINDEYRAIGERKIATSEVKLTTLDDSGNRLIRNSAANIGDFCADAYRITTGADIGVMNGGGIRADIEKGDVTFNDILSVFPFNNSACVVQVNGQIIKDMLEMGLEKYPLENGSFPHVSGLKYKVNTAISSSVTLDENGVFVSVDGEYRVYNIMVLNGETGEYELLSLEKEYTVASHNYMLLDQGDGMSMFKNAKIIMNDGVLDVEILEKYIVENLKGVIGDQYAFAGDRIVFTEGEIDDTPKYEYPELPEYTVTYVIDGVTVATQKIKQGSDALPPEIPAKEGYTAVWDKDGKGISEDTVITAVYTPIEVAEPQNNTVIIIVCVVVSVFAAAGIATAVVVKKKKEKRDNQ